MTILLPILPPDQDNSGVSPGTYLQGLLVLPFKKKILLVASHFLSTTLVPEEKGKTPQLNQR